MKYKVTGCVNHDGVPYPDGSVIELSSEEAKPLLKVKAIGPYHQPYAQKEKAARSDNEGGGV